MKALQHILIWTVLLGVRAASAQELVADLTPPVERGAASFEVWANQRTNAFNSGFAHTAQQGGFLSREFLQDMDQEETSVNMSPLQECQEECDRQHGRERDARRRELEVVVGQPRERHRLQRLERPALALGLRASPRGSKSGGTRPGKDWRGPRADRF